MSAVLGFLIGLIQLLGKILFDWWGWVLVVAILGYLIWQNRRREHWVSDSEYSLLLIEVPKDNEKQALSAEQMFAALHGILRPRQELVREGSIQEHISFEITSIGSQIRFYVWTPKHLRGFVEGQIYAQYPTVNIREVSEDYAKREFGDKIIEGAEMSLINSDVVPIRTFKSFEVDPLAGIGGVLGKLEESGEEAWIQILARPVDDNWHARGETYIQNLRDGKKSTAIAAGAAGFLKDLAIALVKPPAGSGGAATKPELSDQQKAQVAAAAEKISKLGYEVALRIVHLGPDRRLSRLRLQSLVGAFKQFNDSNNGFKIKEYISGEAAQKRYSARFFAHKGFTLNIEELASLYHLPHMNVETPGTVWATTKTAEPPSNLPRVTSSDDPEISPVGTTNFRGSHLQFGLKRNDRGRHVYIVGQTGTGKSYLMQLMILSDIYHNQGFAIIDPHGDLATNILRYIPEHRLEDVIYFNPGDMQNPMAFNPLEVPDPSLKGHIASEVVGVLEKMFGYSWGPRLEHILRYTLLALLDYPSSTMMGITRMLTDKDYRKRVVKEIDDPVVKNFWTTEFASWTEKFASEAIAPVLNKVGAFTSNPLIRNIIGQPKSAFNIRKMMDDGKILVVNLSRGQVGEDNAATLGALLVTKIQLAAMSRSDIDRIEDRRPFYLYVDEFQNFATGSFAVILSEARKYGLYLTIANQYVSQMEEEVRDAVFGNVGTMIVFRIGADDGMYIGKYVEPTFIGQDLINLHNRNFVISMSIDGEKASPFTASSLLVPSPLSDHTPAIIERTRSKYASPKAVVEEKIYRWANLGTFEHKPNTPSHHQPYQPTTKSQQPPATKPPSASHQELKPDQPVKLR
ncbi:ATP-binding protein [Candidatus Microgenomates bacterium]|nr:ATP-binding protein [Candidatus Microgenomates bacterium]